MWQFEIIEILFLITRLEPSQVEPFVGLYPKGRLMSYSKVLGMRKNLMRAKYKNYCSRSCYDESRTRGQDPEVQREEVPGGQVFILLYFVSTSLTLLRGLYCNTFYGRNCCCIVLGSSVSHYHSLPPYSNIPM
jgi:hypothetical protein